MILRACSIVSNCSTQNLYFLIIEGGVGIFMINVWWRQISLWTFVNLIETIMLTCLLVL
jgi:hypothetical protein